MKLNTPEDIAGFEKLEDIYVERNSILWKNNLGILSQAQRKGPKECNPKPIPYDLK